MRNDLGLLAEEYNPGARRLLGNYPQAFSHIALVNSAFNLAKPPYVATATPPTRPDTRARPRPKGDAAARTNERKRRSDQRGNEPADRGLHQCRRRARQLDASHTAALAATGVAITPPVTARTASPLGQRRR
jgi:hypothetical protein